jgi:hypothetical protein
VGARRAVSANNDLGVRLELDEVQGHALVGVRALDYRYRFSDAFALGLFLGAARYNLATPAYSVYYGVGALWRNVLPKWDLGLDVRHAQNLARDHMLADDPQGVGREFLQNRNGSDVRVAPLLIRATGRSRPVPFDCLSTSASAASQSSSS